jgi:predicted Zn-dependent peptidase
MVIQQKDNLDRVIFNIVFENSGAMFAKEGVANFLAKMLQNRGSTKTPNSKFLRKLDNNAIYMSVLTNIETITIHCSFLREKQKIALNLLKELLTYPNFTQESFAKTKDEIISQIQQKQNDFDYVAHTLLNKVSFKDTPLEYPIMGEKIEFELDDVKKHFKKFFIQENISFIVGGNYDEIDFEEFISLFPKGKKEPILYFEPTTGYIEVTKPTQQAYIHFNAPYRVDKDELHKAKVASFILGAGGFGSRILEEIRVKRGLAYSAYIRNSFHNHTKIVTGYMQTKLTTQKDAIDLLKNTIEEFVKNGVTEDELLQTKQFLIGSEPLSDETLMHKLVKEFNEYYHGYKKGHYKHQLQLIEKLSLDQLNSFIKKHNEILDISFAIVKG